MWYFEKQRKRWWKQCEAKESSQKSLSMLRKK